MNHDINLNIHYSAPKEIWEQIDKIYESMPYWSGNKNRPQWIGKDVDLGLLLNQAEYRLLEQCRIIFGKNGIACLKND